MLAEELRGQGRIRIQLFVLRVDGASAERTRTDSLVLARAEGSASDANASEDRRDDYEDEGELDLHLLAEVDLDTAGRDRLNPLRGAHAAEEHGPSDDREHNRNAEHAADRVSR